MNDIAWWCENEQYYYSGSTIKALQALAGPHGVATVNVNKDGTTSPGWGLLGRKLSDGTRKPGFMPLYMQGMFNERVTAWRFGAAEIPFAFITRSMRIVVVDIDGKNGGFSGALALGDLPHTLAETSKSGNGYHLFYSTDEPWDADLGYALYDDHIGIVPGVDIRATGCVFHYAPQRWNENEIAPLPDRLKQMLELKKERRVASAASLDNLKEMDDVDKLVAHHTLLADLAKPIPAGQRNNTLFAIGSKMRVANVPDWETSVRERAHQLGLDWPEADKLVDNIAAYGS